MQEAHKRFLDAAESYALRSGRCMRCGKTLTVPASLHRGLGPGCAGRESATATEIARTPRFDPPPARELRNYPERSPFVAVARIEDAEELPF